MAYTAFVEGSSQLRPDDYPNMTSTPIQPLPYANLVEDVEAAHRALAELDEELHPPSRPASPNFESRTDALKVKVVEAMKYAAQNPRSAKWKRVADLLKLASTSRRYVGAAPGVRVGEMGEVDLGNYNLVLPDTEEEWEQCEERWARRFERPPTPEGRTSRFFATGAEASSSKAAAVRDKVKAWQATIVAAPPSGTPEVSETGDTVSTKGKGKEADKPRQSPLAFPVVKRHATAIVSGKGTPVAGKNGGPAPQRSPQPVEQATSDEQRSPSKAIADLSETEYIPPSFPQQLQTSTPLPSVAKKSKPPPIPHQLASSPSSSPQLPNSLDVGVPPPASSSRPSHPSPDAAKRTRPITPPSETSQRSPLAKRTKTTPEAVSTSLVPAQRPSTPPPPASPPHTPPRTLSYGKGLGNAKGLPVPRTPERGTPGQLPTLTELLASSRRSRPRPRPPSRKLKSRTTTPAPEDPADVDALPTLAEAARDPSPAPTAASRVSRARTLLSSPASGSSDSSPQSLRSRPRSPVSPLFGHSAPFAPPFASTQAAGGLAPLPATQSQMMYNSQFDVEGQIGMVSDLLERDVDFDGWLRDIPEHDS